ncbi:hypothetical protein BDV97DRAFT_394516 [Delphinella strobiligena]|nr:hypothetical protein BDV97DRAFT_394516 [Delphinella strobiligena]
MTSFITNYIQNTATNLLATGITAAGNVAGNAVGGVGQLIENSGRSVGDGVANGIKSWGDYVNSYGDRAVGATAASGGVTAVKKTAVKPKTTTSTAQKTLTAPVAQKALPPAGGKLKALPASPSTSQSNKKVVSASAKPSPKVDSTPNSKTALPNLPQTSTSNLPKTTTTNLPKPSSGSIPGSGAQSAKKTISAASRPKPAGISTIPSPKIGPTLNLPKPPTGPTPVGKPISKPPPPKSNTTSSGKTMISAASRPQK